MQLQEGYALALSQRSSQSAVLSQSSLSSQTKYLSQNGNYEDRNVALTLEEKISLLDRTADGLYLRSTSASHYAVLLLEKVYAAEELLNKNVCAKGGKSNRRGALDAIVIEEIRMKVEQKYRKVYWSGCVKMMNQRIRRFKTKID